jgi:hypothetical protein
MQVMAIFRSTRVVSSLRLSKGAACLLRFFSVLALLLASVAPASAAESTEIRYYPSGQIYDYRWQLLALALAHTGGAPVQLRAYREDVSQNRAMELLHDHAIDVIALGVSPERMSRLLPVRIDILRGILGYRILFVRADEQSKIKAMDDERLRRNLLFGMGAQWADVPIMQSNGFRVETSPGYENLFDMLEAGRFDAFARGLNEINREAVSVLPKYPNLVVESSKALYYPYPVYFFVNRENVSLARRIELGLKLALADGSFRRLFLQDHGRDIALQHLKLRHVICLRNSLPDHAMPPDTSWWWKQPAGCGASSSPPTH